MTNWEKIVSGDELAKAAKERAVPYHEKKAYTSATQDIIDNEKYYPVSLYKDPKYTKFRKDKPADEVFEDFVWTTFYKMGFTEMNKDNQFRMKDNPDNDNLTQQVDVFAVEEDAVFIIECKESDKESTLVEDNAQFKKEVEALYGMKEGFTLEAKKRYPNKEVVFIWATQNVQLGDKAKERLETYGITHFNDNQIKYYAELAAHLGHSARYQLLGNVLAGKEIKNMKMTVPALKSTMGDHEYFALSVEPAKLLKIGYVLHRNLITSDTLPSYQRVIKKSRLQEVHRFIEEHNGFFPNSIIVTLDTGDEGVKFESLGTLPDSHSEVGILELPKKYHSAYVIDGQHRLYGYSESKKASKDCIPVVAFVNLDRTEQLKMFMDINTNQKAVPKGIRVSLAKDLYWDSKEPALQRVALRSKIVQKLAEDANSPLFNRILLGDDTKKEKCCITAEAVQAAFNKSNFFNTYNKGEIKEKGTFELGDLDKTCNRFIRFIETALNYMKTECPDQWNAAEKGVLTINRGIQAVIRVIDFIVTMLVSQNKIDPKKDSMVKMMSEISVYMKPLADYLNKMTPEAQADLKQTFGTNADAKFYYYFQKPIADAFPEYRPEGIDEFIENQSKKYNDETREFLKEVEKKLRVFVKKNIEGSLKDWARIRMPKEVFGEMNKDKANKLIDTGIESDVWEFAGFKELAKIISYGSNWPDIFQNELSFIDDKDVSGKKSKKKTDNTAWITECGNMLEKLSRKSGYSVSKESRDKIEKINEWLGQK